MMHHIFIHLTGAQSKTSVVGCEVEWLVAGSLAICFVLFVTPRSRQWESLLITHFCPSSVVVYSLHHFHLITTCAHDTFCCTATCQFFEPISHEILPHWQEEAERFLGGHTGLTTIPRGTYTLCQNFA